VSIARASSFYMHTLFFPRAKDSSTVYYTIIASGGDRVAVSMGQQTACPLDVPPTASAVGSLVNGEVQMPHYPV
jgi:hypothetical protein